MTQTERLQCHAFLTALRFTYDPNTTDSPTLKMIQLCDLLGVTYRPIHQLLPSEIHRFNLGCDAARWWFQFTKEQREFILFNSNLRARPPIPSVETDFLFFQLKSAQMSPEVAVEQVVRLDECGGSRIPGTDSY